MTTNQQQMLRLIQSFIATCSKLENNNEGLSTYFFQSRFVNGFRENEQRLDRLFDEDDLSLFTTCMMALRNDWLMCVNEFRKVQKEII